MACQPKRFGFALLRKPSSVDQFQVRQGEADTEIEYARYTNKEVQAIPPQDGC